MGAHPEQWAAAAQRPGSRWGVSGALLEGTSSVDEVVGECCTTTPPRPLFCLPVGIRTGNPPVTGPTP